MENRDVGTQLAPIQRIQREESGASLQTVVDEKVLARSPVAQW
jgi:hypothetical protein